MTHKNNDEFLSMSRTLDRYASKHRLFPEYEYTSCVIEEYVDRQDHSYTFCMAPHSENSKLVSLSRCSTNDTPSRIKGQNQAALNLNKGDVVFNYKSDHTIESFTFFDAEEEEDTITINNIDALGRPVLHSRHACFLLALSYSLARDYSRNGHTYFSIYNISHIVTTYLSAYFKFAEREYREMLNSQKDGTYNHDLQDNEPSLELEIEYWNYLDFVPFALTFVRYAFYYYKCMIFNLEGADYPSLNEYIYELWLQDSDRLTNNWEINSPTSVKSPDTESDSMH